MGFTLSRVLPEIHLCHNLADAARDALSHDVAELLDGQGMPHARDLPLLRPLLACWTRCQAFGKASRRACWNENAQTQYNWLVRNALLLSLGDGRQPLAEDAPAWDLQLLAAALELGGDDDDEDIAGLALPPALTRRSKRIVAKLPAPGLNSEWSEIAVLRTAWRRGGPMLTVDYSAEQIKAELTCGGETILRGDWQAEIRVNGRLATPDDDWECVCWESDADVDYLELELDLTENVRVQRQFLLARDDLFLFVADAVLGAEPADIEYRLALPLAEGVSHLGGKETWDARLKGRRRCATVLPLAIDEWRRAGRAGSFDMGPSGLEYVLRTDRASLYAPLFFDLNPRRQRHEPTWRRLTVADTRVIQPPDVAVGYRVQVGQRQWLFYRSLAETASRTVLGVNLTHEFLAARFGKDGVGEELLEIE